MHSHIFLHATCAAQGSDRSKALTAHALQMVCLKHSIIHASCLVPCSTWLTTSTSSLSPTFPVLQSSSPTHSSLLSHEPHVHCDDSRRSYGSWNCTNTLCFEEVSKYPWSFGIFWQFSAQICFCSGDTELIYRNSRAENPFNVFFTTAFSLLLNSPLSIALVARNTGWLHSAMFSIICSAVLAQTPSGLPE